MAMNFLEFEQPIAELEAKIEELKFLGSDASVNITEEIKRLQSKSRALTSSIFANLSPWQITQLARHPQRPYTLDYVSMIFTDWHELHGDRMYSDDLAIVGGLARLEGMPVMLIGHQKGRDTKERVRRNYGMPKPEGYRKALRLMKMAERFRIPVITLIDTPGAYPGIGSEERGQSEAIARNLFEMSQSGGAGLERGDRRGRLGRRARHRRLRPAGHAAVQRLLGHFPGSLRLDPVEEHRQEGNRRRGHGRNGGAAQEAGPGRRGPEGAARRRASRSAGHGGDHEAKHDQAFGGTSQSADDAIARCAPGALARLRRVPRRVECSARSDELLRGRPARGPRRTRAGGRHRAGGGLERRRGLGRAC